MKTSNGMLWQFCSANLGSTVWPAFSACIDPAVETTRATVIGGSKVQPSRKSWTKSNAGTNLPPSLHHMVRKLKACAFLGTFPRSRPMGVPYDKLCLGQTPSVRKLGSYTIEPFIFPLSP